MTRFPGWPARAAAGALGPLALALSAACGGAPRPDVVLIVCDTLRADAVLDRDGLYDTPGLDALARDGVVFERAFAHAPMTLPSHTAIFSSRPPLETGVWVNGEDVPADLPLLPEWLAEHGWQTRAVISLGTLNLGNKRVGLRRGFDDYDVDFLRMSTAEETAPRVTRAVEGLDPDRPAFLFAHYADPHEPYNSHGVEHRSAELTLAGAPLATLATSDMTLMVRSVELPGGASEFALRSHDPFRLRWFQVEEEGRVLPVAWDGGERLVATRSVRLTVDREPGAGAAQCTLKLWINDAPDPDECVARYRREAAASDRAIGRLLDELRASGRYDRSLIVFTSDHGESLGEHGHFGHAKGLTDPQIHVPLIVKLPRGDPRAARLAEAAGRLTPQVDLAPTILELVGVPPLPGARGTSLLRPHEAVLVTETHVPEAPEDQIALRDERFKLTYYPDGDRFVLHDLERDPGERTDVFAERGAERPEWPAHLRALAEAGRARRDGAGEVDAATADELRALGYAGRE